MKKLLTILATLVVLGLIGTGLVTWWNSRSPEPDPSSAAGDGASTVAETPQPEPDWCPSVQVMAVPGTWESHSTDDPFAPQTQPSYLSLVTAPLQERYDINDVRVWTVPYAAQFRNINALGEMSYDDSQAEGRARIIGEMEHVHGLCPSTDFIMVGFSQGAVIAGDIANSIGLGNGPVPAERMRGIALLADGRREPGVGQTAGAEVEGIGAELSLLPFNDAIQFIVPGATMRGAREGGFGLLNDRVVQICAPGDIVCDAPRDVGNGVQRALEFLGAMGVHAQYGDNYDVFGDRTANEWLVDWAINLIGH